MTTEEQYRAIKNDSSIQLYLYKAIGEYARDHVLRKIPDAVALYSVDSDGRRTHVGIYDTSGMEVTAKGNFTKEQYPAHLVGKLDPYSSACREEYIGKLNTRAWVSAFEALHKPSNDTGWYFDWLKRLTGL